MIAAAPLAKAARIRLCDRSSPARRAFHFSWMALFVFFFARFACAPLLPVITGESALTSDLIANISIAAAAVTIVVRLLMVPLCDRYGSRKACTGLLLFGAIPLFGVATAQRDESLLLVRLATGMIGARVVITPHLSRVMFAPNAIGTANTAAAGWGKAGGGATPMLMLVVAALLLLGAEQSGRWRIALLMPGLLMLAMAWACWNFTQDCPADNRATLRATGLMPGDGQQSFEQAAAERQASTA